MVQIKFAPISSDKLIPGTNVNIQVGIIQTDNDRSWGVKLTQKGKVIAAKKIKKLIDVEITAIIRDTIGKLVALDTFELGGMLSGLLREVYDKIQEKQKPAAAAPATASAPKPAPPAPAPQAPADFSLPEIKLPQTKSSDSFWSAYSNIETSSESFDTAYQGETPVQESPSPYSSTPTQQAPAESGLDDALAILGIKCPSCGRDVDPDLDKCPHCGNPV